MPIARGTLLGFIIGIIPGSAHIISSFLSYALEKRVSKHPEEFGKGAVAGVAGPETANNAASTGAFVPLLALGIPTSPITAVLIGALMMHGVSVGPTLVNEHPDVFWGFVASMYVGNLMLLALNLPLVSVFVTVLRIPYAYLYPLIIMFCIIGVYEVNNSIVDVWIMLIMGVLGYALRKFEFDPAPLVLGLVIAPILEQSLRQSLIMSNGNYLIFFNRPISAGLLVVSAVLLALAALSFILKRKDWRTKLAEAEAGEIERWPSTDDRGMKNLTIDPERLWDDLMETARIGAHAERRHLPADADRSRPPGARLVQGARRGARLHRHHRRHGHDVRAARRPARRHPADRHGQPSRHPADRRQIRRRARRAGARWKRCARCSAPATRPSRRSRW